jgi:hypothetical protein
MQKEVCVKGALAFLQTYPSLVPDSRPAVWYSGYLVKNRHKLGKKAHTVDATFLSNSSISHMVTVCLHSDWTTGGKMQDTDIMWFRDPFPRFDKSADLQIACDKYTGIPEDLDNQPNGGFVYARSNNRTIDFYKYWYMSREDHPGLHDQDVLNEIKFDQDFVDLGLELRFLNTLYFGGFCEVKQQWFFSMMNYKTSSTFVTMVDCKFGSC